jgi:transcriptional regulator with PAS, ATPase and Fis domain
MAKLHEYPFPGNIRELESLIKRMVFLNDPCIPLYDQTADECVFTGLSLKEQMLSFEKKVIKNALEKCRTTREMANFLGINQSNVVRKLKKHNLS